MPSSNRSGTASLETAAACRGRALQRPGRRARRPRCGPKNLYGEQPSRSAPSAPRRRARAGRGAPRRRTPARRPRARRAAIAGTSGRVPRRLEAPVTATTRVALGEHRLDVRARRSRGRSRASARWRRPLGGQHPGSDVRVVVESGDDHLVAGVHSWTPVRDRSNVSWVIGRPKTTAARSAPSRSPTAARAPATMRSARCSASVTVPRLDQAGRQRPGHRLRHRGRHLGPARPVEVRGSEVERREGGADAGRIQVRGHAAMVSDTVFGWVTDSPPGR